MQKPVKTGVLPEGVIEADLKYPTKGRCSAESLKFYYSARFGWCIATLPINNKGRTYGVNSAGTIVSIGGRPDDKIIYVYVSEARQPKLQKYLDLRAKGLGDAGSIRDRIGSRRAQGQVMRAQGRHSWTWDS